MKRFTLLLAVLLPLSVASAKVDEQKELNFKIRSEELFKGDIHYSVQSLEPRELEEKYPDFADLDSLSMAKKKPVTILVSKFAFIVKKPIGFFDHEHMTKPGYLAHILGDQRVTKDEKKENHFVVKKPAQGGHQYHLKTFYDSDDLSSLANRRVIQAVTATKKLDVLAQSATATAVMELSHFSQPVIGSVQVSSYMSLREDRTLVIGYSYTAFPNTALVAAKKADHVREVTHLKKLIEGYGDGK